MNIPYYITCLCALLAVVLIGLFLVGMEFAGVVTGLPFHNYMVIIVSVALISGRRR